MYKFKNQQFYLLVGLAFWAFMVVVDFLTERSTFAPRLVNSTWLVVYLIAANYLFLEKIVPLLAWKRPLRSLLLLGAQFLVFSFGLYCWRFIGIQIGLYTPFKVFERLTDGVCNFMVYSVVSAVFFGINKHLYDHVRLRQMAQQLRIEKQEAELHFLKSQTNPHFLFNTLNNIYSLARDKSDLAPESILRLSGILRFMLYETGGATIEIGEEVKIISDYVALEKLRYDDSLRVDFKYEIPDLKQPIPPLLLIPLVENAFKHGIAETRQRPLLQMFLSVHHRQLHFWIKNTTDKPDETGALKENIGLTNLRRQLELLYTAYDLAIQQTPDTFVATLKIDLDSHV